MKYMDTVRLVSGDYKEFGLKIGDIGTLLEPEIRSSATLFFLEEVDSARDAVFGAPVYIGDLEVVEEANVSDEALLEALPMHNPEWWCKVEDGYIWNLKGEKKNEVPYDYGFRNEDYVTYVYPPEGGYKEIRCYPHGRPKKG